MHFLLLGTWTVQCSSLQRGIDWANRCLLSTGGTLVWSFPRRGSIWPGGINTLISTFDHCWDCHNIIFRQKTWHSRIRNLNNNAESNLSKLLLQATPCQNKSQAISMKLRIDCQPFLVALCKSGILLACLFVSVV